MATETEVTGNAALRTFRRFLVFHVAAETWVVLLKSTPHAVDSGALQRLAGVCGHPSVLLALVPSVAALVVWRNRWARWAATAAAAARLGFIVWTFPNTANHIVLELVCLVFLGWLDVDRRDEQVLAMQALRWTIAIVLFSAGLQKLLYGLYFRGEYLAAAISFDWRYAALFQHLLPAAELARLRAIGEPYDGSGPYLVASTPLILLSNATYVAEMILPFTWLIRAARPFGVVAALTLIVCIQLGARELFFGALFASLVLLFPKRNCLRRCAPLFAALELGLVASRLNVLPEWFFN